MSQAFIREGDEQTLGDIPPTLTALIRLLTLENNGLRVNHISMLIDNRNREVYNMSNGVGYFKNESGKWEAI